MCSRVSRELVASTREIELEHCYKWYDYILITYRGSWRTSGSYSPNFNPVRSPELNVTAKLPHFSRGLVLIISATPPSDKSHTVSLWHKFAPLLLLTYRNFNWNSFSVVLLPDELVQTKLTVQENSIFFRSPTKYFDFFFCSMPFWYNNINLLVLFWSHNTFMILEQWTEERCV